MGDFVAPSDSNDKCEELERKCQELDRKVEKQEGEKRLQSVGGSVRVSKRIMVTWKRKQGVTALVVEEQPQYGSLEETDWRLVPKILGAVHIHAVFCTERERNDF